MEKGKVWVGRFKRDGKVFLYDPEINPPDSEDIQLFLKGDEVLIKFNRSSIRAEVETEQNETSIIITKSSYVRWKFRKEHNLNKAVAIVVKSKKKRKASSSSKVKNIKSRIIRNAPCYCGLPVSSKGNRDCNKCGWLICAKGHCGCDFRRS